MIRKCRPDDAEDLKIAVFNNILMQPATDMARFIRNIKAVIGSDYEYSYNLVHLLQSKARIHRLGLPDGQYTQYYYDQVVYQTEDGNWSLGEAIYNRLKEKEEIMLEAIANRRLEVMPTSKEDLDLIFGRNISD